MYDSSHLACLPRTSSAVAGPPGNLAPRPASRATARFEPVSSCHGASVAFVCTSMYSRMTGRTISRTAVQLVLIREYCCGSIHLLSLSVDPRTFMFGLAATLSHIAYNPDITTAAAAHPGTSIIPLILPLNFKQIRPEYSLTAANLA